MRPWRGASALLGAALVACAARGPGRVPPVTADPLREAVQAREVAVAFVSEEGRGDAAADTLLAPDADFINSGVVVTARPRLAAVLGPGDAEVEDLRIQLAGGFAWVVAAYRWQGETDTDVERGRVTIILERRNAAWRIRHVHSSSVPPWQ
jgi:Domain of unknown function (DUF4440)